MERTRDSRQRGLFFVFEGLDGSGKSTQLRLLAESLQQTGRQVVSTFEPTDGAFGRKIRQMMRHRDALAPGEELELFLADRREHVRDLITPSLAAGKIVLCDRYFLSTAAYQGALGHDPEQLLAQNESFAPIPDLVLLIELPAAEGVHRIRSLRGETPNDFEKESYLAQVGIIFASLSRPYIVRIRGDRPVAEIQGEILAEVAKFL